MKFYYNDKNNDVWIIDECCCEHMKNDWQDDQLLFKCFDGNKIKVFGMSERLARLLSDCPYCHEKIVTERVK